MQLQDKFVLVQKDLKSIYTQGLQKMVESVHYEKLGIDVQIFLH